MKRNLKICLLFALIFILPLISYSATFTSQQDGNWFNPATWGGSYPGAGDIVIIQAGHNITLSSSTTTSEIALAGNLTVNSGITLNCSSSFTQSNGLLNNDGTIVVTGDFIGSGGSIDIANLASLTAANVTVNNFTLNSGGSLNTANFEITGTGNLSGTSNISGNFTISGSASVNLGANLTISGIFYLTAGTINLNTNQLTINNNISYSGGKINASNSNSTIVIGAAGTSTFNSNWLTSTSIGNLTINRTVSLSGNLNIAGILNLSGGNLNISGANILTLNQDISGANQIITNSSSSLILQGSTSWNLNNVLNGISALNDLTINLSHITDNAVATNTDLTIAGTLTISDGYLDISGDQLTLNNDISVGGKLITDNATSLVLQGSSSWVSTRILTGISTLNNLSINLTHPTNNVISTNNNFEILGNLTINNGFLNIYDDQLTLNNDISSGGKIQTNSSSSMVLQGNSAWSTSKVLNNISSLNNLTININNASNTIATNTNLTITGNLTISNGTLDISGDQLTLYNDVNAGGNINTNSSSSLILTGNSVWNTNRILTGITNLNNLSINLSNSGNNIINQVEPSLTIAGDISIASGTFNIGSNTLNLNGDLSLSSTGSFVSSETGKVLFNGTSSISNSGTGIIIFGEIEVSATKSVSTNTSFEVKNTITVNTNSSFTASSGTISIIGSSSVDIVNNGTLSFYDLEIKSSSSGCTPSSGFVITRHLYVNNTFNPSAGTITFSGTTQQGIYGTNEPIFYNLKLNNSAGLKLYQNIRFISTAQSILTLSSGDLDLNGPYIIYFQYATDKLSETAGNNIVNNGSSPSGYLTTKSNITSSNLSTSNIGLTLSSPSNLTVRMYPATACNDGIPSVKRYFKVTFSGTINTMTLSYDNTELYGTASNLSIYSSSDLTDWEKNESSATSGSNTGSVSGTNDLSLTSPIYFALFTKAKFFSNDAGTGLWSDPINWKDSTKPEKTDVVVIGSYTVYLDQDVTITDLVLSKSDTYLKPLNNGTYNLTLLGNLTCGGTSCADPSTAKFNGVNGNGRINLIFNNESQKTITTYQDEELKLYNIKITDGSSVVTSGNYKIYVSGDFVVKGTGSFISANGTNIYFDGTQHIAEFNRRKAKRNKIQTDYISSPGEQTIENSSTGTLTFGKVTIADGSLVTTSSNFTVTNQFQVLGSGSFIADAGTITFNGSPVTISKSNSGTMKFNKIINTGSISTDASFYIQDDLVTTGNFTQTDGEIIFENNANYIYPKQIINNGGATIQFASLYVEKNSYVTTSSNLIIADDTENYIEVKDGGYFKSTGTTTIGAVGATGTTIITKSNNAFLEFRNLTIADVSVQCSTASDFTINGDFIVNSSATFTATPPSTIKFKNDRTSGLIQNISGSSRYQIFNALTIDDITTVQTSTSFTLTGNLNILGNGSLTASSPSTIVFDGSGTKNINNNGTLQFYDLTIASSSNGNNTVNTKSNFTIANELITQGNSTNGRLIASGESLITLGNSGVVTNTLTGAVGEGSSLEFVNLKIPSGVTQNISSSFKIKGDLINDGTLSATSGTISFIGSRQQKILGSNQPTFYSVILNNTNGLLMEKSISFANGGGGTLQLIQGDIDLGGNNIITMSNASATLVESSGNTIINTKKCDGAGNGGYITSSTIGTANGIDDIGLGLDISGSSASNIVVRRYSKPIYLNGVESISKYYYLSYSNAISSATLTIDDEDLNGNNVDELALFYSSSDASSSWTSISSTFTDGDNVNRNGYNLIYNPSFTGFQSGYYFTAFPKYVKIALLPISGLTSSNKISESPLIAGSTSKIIFAFSVYSNANIDYLEKFKLNFGDEISTKLENLALYYDTDGDLTTNGKTNTNCTISINSSEVTFSNINLSLSSGQYRYLFIIADVKNSVDNNTRSIRVTLNSSDIDITNAKIINNILYGDNLNFSKHLIEIDNQNSPNYDYLVKSGAGKNQIIYGFRLKKLENSPNVILNSVKLKFDVKTSALSEFSNAKLWKDVNRNGKIDASDSNVGATISKLSSDGYLSFSGLSQTLSSNTEFLISVQVSDTATTGGTIQLNIEDNSYIDVSFPALLNSSAPYIGRRMTIIEKNVPTKLEILNISPASYVNGYGSKNLISGQNNSITIATVDDNGKFQPVTENTQIQINIYKGKTIISGTKTVTVSKDEYEKTWNTLILTNNTGEEDLEISAEVISGMDLQASTLSGIKINPSEPTSSPSSLTITEVKANSVSLNWTAGNPSNHIVVVRKNEIPVSPSNGEEYLAVSGGNINNINSSKNQTSNGSIVTYVGQNTSTTVFGLESNSRYYFAVYTYDGTGNVRRYLENANTGDYLVIVDTTTFGSEPNVAPSDIVFTEFGSDFLKLKWTNGNGARRIVVCKENSNIASNPIDGKHYPANSIFGIDSSEFEDGFTVYNGTGNQVIVSGLKSNTTYYFKIFEYNGYNYSSNYFISSASNSRKTLKSEPTEQAKIISFTPTENTSVETFSSSNQIKVNWVNGNGDGRIVLVKLGSEITADDYPTDGTVNYSSINGSVSLGEYPLGSTSVIYNGTGSANSSTITGVSSGQKYYFQVFEYNGDGTTVSDNSNVNYNTDDTENNPNYYLADRYESNDNKDNLELWKFISSDNNSHQGTIAYENDEDWFYVYLDFENNKNNARLILKNLSEDYAIELYNSMGRMLRRADIIGTNNEYITINNLPEGIYFIRIYSRTGAFSFKPYYLQLDSKSLRYFSNTE